MYVPGAASESGPPPFQRHTFQGHLRLILKIQQAGFQRLTQLSSQSDLTWVVFLVFLVVNGKSGFIPFRCIHCYFSAL